ncbi:hypothetical protein F5Y17DRAFT_428778 [Xylariaceae sp. FL0594]|nr:hypothetical protein F5Y17DRAFT_428778 [Xylariaceae sp. FL0594]
MSSVPSVLNGQPPSGFPGDRISYYREVDDERNNLIQNMMQKIDEDAKRIRNLQLDLDDQKTSRAHYQAKAMASDSEVARWRQKINTGSFVVMLIDGDGAKFRDEFLRDPEHGAVKAAWKLKEAVKSSGFGHDVPIIVRAYANVNDLAKSLRLSGVVDHEDRLRTFVENFTNTTADFDFTNVGRGKENADSKIRKLLDHYYKNVQCQKIFVACCHDNGYLHDLRQYAGEMEKKIVLVETTPAEPSFRSLGFPIVRFDTVFRTEPLQNENKRGASTFTYVSPPAQLAPGPIARAIQATYGQSEPSPPESRALKTPTLSSGSVTASPVMANAVTATTQPAPSPQANRPPTQSPVPAGASVVSSGNGGTSISYANVGGTTELQNVTVKVSKTKPRKFALYNETQCRLDPPTQHPPRTLAQTTYQDKFQSIKPKVLCNDHYLKGYCRRGANCEKEHGVELNAAELAIHRYKARTSLCPLGPYCTDPDCYLSHHCPRQTCNRNTDCPFYKTKYGDLHYTKEQLQPKQKWYEGSTYPEDL